MTKNVNITTFPSLYDLIAPHSCLGCDHIGTILCDRCKKYIIAHHRNICPSCKQPKTTATCPTCDDLPPIYVAGKRSGLLNDLIHDLKYNSNRSIARELADILHHTLPPDLPANTLIVPLPTSTRHIRERGLDHTLLIAKHLARLRGWRIAKPLERAKNTVQVGSSKSDRLTQADTAYEVSSTFKANSAATYLLLDDVWTTGATMRAAAKKLQNTGARDVRICLVSYSVLD